MGGLRRLGLPPRHFRRRRGRSRPRHILDHFGLKAGLRCLVDSFDARTGIQAILALRRPAAFPMRPRRTCFASQEALTKVARHAAARRVAVKLESGGGEIRRTIQVDHGCLAAAPAPEVRQAARPRPLGIIGMRARARSAGADGIVRSRPGEVF